MTSFLISIPIISLVGGIVLGNFLTRRNFVKDKKILLADSAWELEGHNQTKYYLTQKESQIRTLIVQLQDAQLKQTAVQAQCQQYEQSLIDINSKCFEQKMLLDKKDYDLIQAHCKRSNAQIELEKANNTIAFLKRVLKHEEGNEDAR